MSLHTYKRIDIPFVLIIALSYEGKTYSEIAKLTRVSQSNVWKYLDSFGLIVRRHKNLCKCGAPVHGLGLCHRHYNIEHKRRKHESHRTVR